MYSARLLIIALGALFGTGGLGAAPQFSAELGLGRKSGYDVFEFGLRPPTAAVIGTASRLVYERNVPFAEIGLAAASESITVEANISSTGWYRSSGMQSDTDTFLTYRSRERSEKLDLERASLYDTAYTFSNGTVNFYAEGVNRTTFYALGGRVLFRGQEEKPGFYFGLFAHYEYAKHRTTDAWAIRPFFPSLRPVPGPVASLALSSTSGGVVLGYWFDLGAWDLALELTPLYGNRYARQHLPYRYLTNFIDTWGGGLRASAQVGLALSERTTFTLRAGIHRHYAFGNFTYRGGDSLQLRLLSLVYENRAYLSVREATLSLGVSRTFSGGGTWPAD